MLRCISEDCAPPSLLTLLRPKGRIRDRDDRARRHSWDGELDELAVWRWDLQLLAEHGAWRHSDLEVLLRRRRLLQRLRLLGLRWLRCLRRLRRHHDGDDG